MTETFSTWSSAKIVKIIWTPSDLWLSWQLLGTNMKTFINFLGIWKALVFRIHVPNCLVVTNVIQIMPLISKLGPAVGVLGFVFIYLRENLSWTFSEPLWLRALVFGLFYFCFQLCHSVLLPISFKIKRVALVLKLALKGQRASF